MDVLRLVASLCKPILLDNVASPRVKLVDDNLRWVVWLGLSELLAGIAAVLIKKRKNKYKVKKFKPS